MTYDCPTYLARHRAQLAFSEGGKYGPVNCTPVGFSRALDQGTCGKELVTGAQIRAASTEPIPDPASPGMNLDQGDDAVFRLTAGRINFDSRRMYDADVAIRRILGGEPAVIQFQRSALISLGFGFGNAFAGGHAASADGIGGLHIDDTLTRRFPVTAAQMKTILGSLLLSTGPVGYGKAYISFAPDMTAAWRVVVHPPSGEFGLYTVDPARRLVTATRVARTGGFSARCTSARSFRWDGHASQSLVILTSGALADRARRDGVVYAVRSGYAEVVA